MEELDPRTPVYGVVQCVSTKCGAVRPILEPIGQYYAVKGHAVNRGKGQARVYRCKECNTRGVVQELDHPMKLRDFEHMFRSWNAKLEAITKGGSDV